MKSVIFTEEQMQNLDAVKAALFCDENDPRSVAYVRKRTRPTIRWFKIICCILLPVMLAAAAIFTLRYFDLALGWSIAIALAGLMLYCILTLKPAIICMIRIYQRYAPDSVRDKCRFEPSCSEYMILAIEKYGVLKGVKKGKSRLKRCNVNGGGFDFP